MKDPIGDINKRIDELEPLQKKDVEYLQKLRQETNNINQRILVRQGAIDELKRLLQPENIFKDAEIVKEKEDAKLHSSPDIRPAGTTPDDTTGSNSPRTEI